MAVIEKWIDPNVAPGGDGSSGSPYSSPAEWDAAEATDLTGGDEHIVYLRSGTWIGSLLLDQWTTSIANNITMKADPGHEHGGALGTGFQWEQNAAFTTAFDVKQVGTVLEDFCIKTTTTSNGSITLQFNTVAANDCVARRLIIGPNLSGNRWAINVAADDCTIESCLIFDNNDRGVSVAGFYAATLKNITIAKTSNDGFTKVGSGAATVSIYNCVSHGATPDYLDPGGLMTGSNNASSDGTQVGTAGIGTIVEADFTDYAANNFTIASESSQLYDAGDPANMAVLGITGQPFTTNDIGCYPYAAAPSGDTTVNLGQAASTGIDATVPTVESPDVGEDHIVNLANAAALGVDATVPTVDSIIRNEVFLAFAARSGIDATDPTVDFPAQHIVNLANAATSGINATAPLVNAGEDAIVNLGNAAAVGIDATVPTIQAEITHFVNLGQAASVGIDATAPQVEGEPFLPPSIITPTLDQTYTFGQSGTLPAPAHDVGTGDNPQWSMPIEDFSTKPGVNQWTIDPNTGTITYNVNMLTTDPNEQALNTKGPYTTTRRLTTTVGNADETFKIFVNVGNYTLRMTPGTPCVTWTTRTPGARGIEPTKDPSPRVTQTYTVT